MPELMGEQNREQAEHEREAGLPFGQNRPAQRREINTGPRDAFHQH
jgi:hypothetical protein